MITDNRIDNLLGPAGTWSGVFIMAAGILTCYFYDLSGLLLVVAGMFLGFTYDGTLIDSNQGRIKGYSCLFGIFRIGKWHRADEFTRFAIRSSRRSYTTYSRANIPLTLKSRDVRLILMNDDGSLKITMNRYRTFDEARKDMSALINDLHLTGLKEWMI